MADISFRIADQSRYEEILQLLYTNFHSDEPMSKAVQMIDREGTRNKVLDDFALQGLVQVSFCNYLVTQQVPDERKSQILNFQKNPSNRREICTAKKKCRQSFTNFFRILRF